MKNIYQENSIVSADYHWQTNRRKWLKLAVAGLVATQIPWWVSCESPVQNENNSVPLDGKGVFTIDEMESLYVIQNLLVPDDGNGPSAYAVNAHSYYVWMLQDKNISDKDKHYFVESLRDLIALCKEKFGKKIHLLPKADQELFIANNISSGWTQTFLSRMITVIFEAMLLDPVYGVNPDEIGWEWLEHTAPNPRPTQENIYPNIYNNIPVYG